MLAGFIVELKSMFPSGRRVYFQVEEDIALMNHKGDDFTVFSVKMVKIYLKQCISS